MVNLLPFHVPEQCNHRDWECSEHEKRECKHVQNLFGWAAVNALPLGNCRDAADKEEHDIHIENSLACNESMPEMSPPEIRIKTAPITFTSKLKTDKTMAGTVFIAISKHEKLLLVIVDLRSFRPYFRNTSIYPLDQRILWDQDWLNLTGCSS